MPIIIGSIIIAIGLFSQEHTLAEAIGLMVCVIVATPVAVAIYVVSRTWLEMRVP